jgi:hypothetical protein
MDSQADNWGCRDWIFCRRRLVRYDRPYRRQERCNQEEAASKPRG